MILSIVLGSSIKEMTFIRTPDASKATRRIAAVQILLDNLLDHRTEIVIFLKEPLEIIKEHPVKSLMFRMMLTVDPCHGREDDSRNGPGAKISLKRADTPGMIKP